MMRKIMRRLSSHLVDRKAKGNQRPESRPVDFSYKSIDHMEFWSNNSRYTADFYINNLGFKLTGIKDVYSGENSTNEYVLENGGVRMIIKSPSGPGNKVFKEFLSKHGDTLRGVTMEVDDLSKLYKRALLKNATIVEEPHEIEDEDGKIKKMSILMFGDIVHTFIEKNEYKGKLLPGYKSVNPEDTVDFKNKVTNSQKSNEPLYLAVDHIGFPQQEGQLQPALQKYYDLGFHNFFSVDEKIIYSENSTLRSTIISDYDEIIKFPIFEPKTKKKKSQIQEFLDYNGGPGAQHIAFEVDDILSAVSSLREKGVEFLKVKPSYYERIEKKLKEFNIDLHADMEEIKKNDIMVDFNEKGFLLQIFTRPVLDRPTLFYEIIQRFKNRSFGEGNFQGLFLSIEEEQRKRGNLV